MRRTSRDIRVANRFEVRDVAAQVNLSERQLSRIFQKATGTSILAYLTRQPDAVETVQVGGDLDDPVPGLDEVLVDELAARLGRGDGRLGHVLLLERMWKGYLLPAETRRVGSFPSLPGASL